jgi:hypothetical protein
MSRWGARKARVVLRALEKDRMASQTAVRGAQGPEQGGGSERLKAARDET